MTIFVNVISIHYLLTVLNFPNVIFTQQTEAKFYLFARSVSTAYLRMDIDDELHTREPLPTPPPPHLSGSYLPPPEVWYRSEDQFWA